MGQIKPIVCPPRPKAALRVRAKAISPKSVEVRALSTGGAELSIYGEIGPANICAQNFALALMSAPEGDLVVKINSEGGDIFDGIAIYNDLVASGRRITVRVTGTCGSAASLVAMAGHKIEIAANGLFMIHECWCEAVGNKHEMREIAEVLEMIDETSMIPTYAARTGMSQNAIRELMKRRDHWMSASDAVAARFCDAVLPLRGVSASASGSSPKAAPAASAPRASSLSLPLVPSPSITSTQLLREVRKLNAQLKRT